MPRPFRRDTEHAVLGGVAAGLGEYFDVDPLLVRLGLVFLAFMNGIGVLFYVVCWVLVPPRTPAGSAGAASAQKIVDGVREAGESAAGEVRVAGERAAGSVRDAGENVATSFRQTSDRLGGARVIMGSFLILFGSILLADQLGWWYWPAWASFSTLWPLVIIALGVSVLTRATGHPGARKP
jgi:phage shock protein PspC (stress-responsive transcriptional regulator)